MSTCDLCVAFVELIVRLYRRICQITSTSSKVKKFSTALGRELRMFQIVALNYFYNFINWLDIVPWVWESHSDFDLYGVHCGVERVIWCKIRNNITRKTIVSCTTNEIKWRSRVEWRLREWARVAGLQGRRRSDEKCIKRYNSAEKLKERERGKIRARSSVISLQNLAWSSRESFKRDSEKSFFLFNLIHKTSWKYCFELYAIRRYPVLLLRVFCSDKRQQKKWKSFMTIVSAFRVSLPSPSCHMRPDCRCNWSNFEAEDAMWTWKQ